MRTVARYAALGALAVAYWTLVYIAHGLTLMGPGLVPGWADLLYLAAGTCMVAWGAIFFQRS